MADVRTAVVTGASSGIGRAVAEALGARGWRVALGARRADRLEVAAGAVRDAGGDVLAHSLDVTDPVSVETFFVAVEATLGPADVLVSNAGIAVPGELHRIDPLALRHEVETNLLGAIYTSRRAVESLRERGARGDLVFVSSDATRHPRPRMAVYSATKAGVELLAHALSLELEGTGIRSTVVRVGPTLTGFGDAWDPDEIADLMRYWPRFGLQRHPGTLAPTDVAAAVITAVTAPPGVHVHTIEVQPECPPAP